MTFLLGLHFFFFPGCIILVVNVVGKYQTELVFCCYLKHSDSLAQLLQVMHPFFIVDVLRGHSPGLRVRFNLRSMLIICLGNVQCI